MTIVIPSLVPDDAVSSPTVPTGALGYGSDLSCGSDLTDLMDEVDPFSQRALGEAIVRRLSTPRGSLPDDGDYGIDLRGYCNKGTTADDIRALASKVRTELQKDDRIDSVTVTVTPSPTGTTLAITLAVRPFDPNLGGFSLTLAVTSAAVLIQELNA